MATTPNHEERGLTTYSGGTGSTGSTGGMLMPLTDSAGARAAIEAYESLKTAIVRPDDIQRIQGRDFLKKSFWRRVSACFGLSLEMISEERLVLDGRLAYRATYRAIAPNGRTMDGDGMCSNAEKGREQWPEHNIRATAHTRAKNRAISDIVGGGEVSAEEMPDDDPQPRQYAQAHTQQRSQPRQPRQPGQQAHAPAIQQAQVVNSDAAEVIDATSATSDAGAWIPERDADIKKALTALRFTRASEQHDYITAMRKQFGLEGWPWDKERVMDYLRLQYKQQARAERERQADADAANGDNGYSLEELPTGDAGAGVH